MREYQIEITETEQGVISVEANSLDEAIEKAEEMVQDEGLVGLGLGGFSQEFTEYDDKAVPLNIILSDLVCEKIKSCHNVEIEFISENELGLIGKLMGHSNEKVDTIIDEYIRIDSKTHRLITSGYIVFEGEGYYANEKDALKHLGNEVSKTFETMQEALEHFGVAEDKDQEVCYYTDWFEFV